MIEGIYIAWADDTLHTSVYREKQKKEKLKIQY